MIDFYTSRITNNLEDIYSFVDVNKNFVYHSNTKIEQNNITFERWALRYLAHYEKGMEIYDGHIDCSKSKYKPIEISSLEGCPKIVKGNFNCSKNNLTSLEGGPEVVEGIFDCSQNKLETLLKTTILPKTNFEIDHRWSGIMGVGKQKNTIVKQVSNNVFCGVRLGGMGIAIGSLIGKELADLTQN